MARQDKHEATLREAGATPDHIRVHRRGCDVLELGLDLYVTFDGRPKDFPIGFSETDPEAWQPGDIALIFSGCGPVRSCRSSSPPGQDLGANSRWLTDPFAPPLLSSPTLGA